MHKFHLSDDDRKFRAAFEAGSLAPEEFSHRAHVRLAYVLLAESDVGRAQQQMRDALHGFLQHHGIAPSKYHETLTRAWILAVNHFMQQSQGAPAADDFIADHPVLLDSRIMLTHYSAEVLFSPAARAAFVEPDLEPIPHPGKATADVLLRRLPGRVTEQWPDGERFVLALAHGSMSVELYAPRGKDPQEPHTQDELYFIQTGAGSLRIGAELHAFRPGDCFFVPAGADHRFEQFSDDFATWAVFWGPHGGE